MLILSVSALLALSAWRHFGHRRTGGVHGAAAVPIWDRTETAEEARLLPLALARPADAAAQTALGQHYLTAGRPFEALWAFQRAREAAGDSPGSTEPNPRRVPAKRVAVSSRTDRGFNPGADPAAEIDLALADALEAGSLRSRALELLTEAAARVPSDAALSQRRADLQLRLGRPAAALQTLRTPNTEHRTPHPSLLLGRVLEASGDDRAALAQYRGCVAAKPGSAEAQTRLGRLLLRLGQAEEGRAALETAHRLAPTDPAPAYALGMSFWPEVARNPDRAGRWFVRALQADSSYRPAQVALGRMYASHQLWKPAAQEFAQALRSNLKDPDALLGLAGVFEATGHLAEAHERRGDAYVAQDKLPQALAEFRAEKALLPQSREVVILISQALIQMQRNGEAAHEIQAAAARNPGDADLRERLAQLLVLSHTREFARRVCEAWLRADPGAPRAFWLRGRIALGDLQLAPAIDAFERAARLTPKDPEILFALGEALSRPTPRRDLPRALALLGQAVELAPREPRYRYQFGLLLQQLDRPEAARRQFLRTLDLDPASTAAYSSLLQVSGKLREPGLIALFAPVIRAQQEAKRVEPGLRRRIYRSPTEPSAYAALARYLAGRGDLKEARAQWEVVAALNPGDVSARQELRRLDRILDVL